MLGQLARVPGHLAVWPGLYAASCVVAFEQFAGLAVRPAWATLGVAFAAGQALYLLDRLKLRDALLDPADEASDPDRFAFLARHAAAIRVWMAAAFLAAIAAALAVHPLLPPLLLAAAVGVVWYAGRPAPTVSGVRRPKDIIVLKNILIAAGLTGFSAALALLDRGDGHGAALAILRGRPLPLLRAGVILGLIVLADSVACDVEDADADRRFGTDTLPARLGRPAGWLAAAGCTLLAAALALAAVPSPAGLRWPALLVPSLAIVGVLFPRRPRDPVDLRLPVIAALAIFL